MEFKESERRASPPPQQAATSRPSVTSRRQQYLIASRPASLAGSDQSLDLNAVREALERDPEITIKRTLTPTGFGPLATGLPGRRAIIVAEMPRERAEQMGRLSHLVVEPDHPLVLSDPTVPFLIDPGVLMPHGAGSTLTIRVTGKDEAPVDGANVFLFGNTWPAQAVTDPNGEAQVPFFGESLTAVRGLYVKPRAQYWSRWVSEPELDASRPNVVALTPLDQTFPNFPEQEVTGWGLRAMRFDQLPTNYRGHGVRVAVVDSGLAAGHQDLKGVVKGGHDVIGQNTQTWDRDEIGHGSHCAGILAGLDNGKGIRGIAPDAEVFAIKVYPDGRFSHLIEALDRCIELQIDIVNLSFGSNQRSELLDDKIGEAKELGVACVVAAGSSSGPVQFPASSPHVLAVAAVGRQGEFPAESYHATQVWEGSPDASEEYFSARFTCFGSEIDVCAPGVAILSCVPPNDYAVWDGTSVAAPHVTGLAALVLAHHPDFQGPFKVRNAARVERLFQILRQSARPLNLGDPNRTGAGMPDAINALLLSRPEVRPEELLQRLLAVVEGGQTAPADRSMLVQQILATFQQAGVTPGAVSAPAPSLDPRFALKQLRGAMQQAGLLPSKGRRAALSAMQRASGTEPSAAAAGAMPGNGWPMRQLTEAMRRSGLL
ncbi:MAG: S8 family serine peptidase [Gemmatimonadales bacterium]